jgi:hypothetical protein
VSEKLISYEELVSQLMEALPELRRPIEAEYAKWHPDVPSQNIIFRDFFNPFLIDAVKRGDRESARRVYAFLERMVCCQDIRVSEIVAYTVFEGLLSKDDIFKKIERNLGKFTKLFLTAHREVRVVENNSIYLWAILFILLLVVSLNLNYFLKIFD